MARYLALAKETSFRSAGSAFNYLHILSHSVNTTREDFYPETVAYWTPPMKVEGFFRSGGDFELPVDPVMFPWILYYIAGPPVSAQQGGTSCYKHTFKFGGDETDIKSFTMKLGVDIEKDRQIVGCILSSVELEARARELVTATCTVLASGQETLVTAGTPSYTAYTQPFFSFISPSTMTIGGQDRLGTAPKIEAFRLRLERGYDEDQYTLGDRYLAAATLNGMATVEGSMEFKWTSQDEYERFMSSVGASEMGDQASFETVLTLRGAQIESSYYYQLVITIPKMQYTASSVEFSGRDRIVQTVDFRGIYDSTTDGAVKLEAYNTTTSY